MSDEHTFPIADDEARKLDELSISRGAELRGRLRVVDLWIRDNAPLATGIALVAGVVAGGALKRKGR
jgi:hypothetical protein